MDMPVEMSYRASIIFAGEVHSVNKTAYRDGVAAWFQILLPGGLAWVRSEECEVS